MMLFYKHRHMYLLCISILSKQIQKSLKICHCAELTQDLDFFNHWSGIDSVLVCNPKEPISSHDIIFEPLPSLLICTHIFYQSRYRSVWIFLNTQKSANISILISFEIYGYSVGMFNSIRYESGKPVSCHDIIF